MARQFQLTAARVTGSCFCPLTQIRTILDQPVIGTSRRIRPLQAEAVVGVGVTVGEGVGVAVRVAEGVRVGSGVNVGIGVGLAVAGAGGVGVKVGVADGLGVAALTGSNNTSAMVLASRLSRKLVFKPWGVMRYVPAANGANSSASEPYSGLLPT